MLTGVLAIQEGMNPKLVRERLAEFVHEPNAKGHAPAGDAARAAA
jgi:flagellar motor component MotA